MKKFNLTKIDLQLFAAGPYDKRFAEIDARKLEIRAMLEGGEEVDLGAVQEELRGLETEEKQLRDRIAVMDSLKGAGAPPAAGQPAAKPGELRTIDKAGQEPIKREVEDKKLSEKRGQDLKENRSVTVGSSNVIMPQHQATDIKPTFNQVSSLIDRVATKTLIGGESYQQPYIAGYGTGDYTDEGADYTTAEATFGYADINKAKITAYAEDTEELQKLPAADYDGEVMKGISIATRKKISREILVGTGATNRLAGIFSAAATAIDAATDLPIIEIDETTLDTIVYSYGGDEDVEDAAVLMLNKKDLKEFALLRDAEGRKIYDVKSNGNTGTIDGIPFIINSACKAVSDGATTAGQYCMAYGPLSSYQVAIFSDMDVQRSTDYQFKKGMIAHRGSVFIGGNVCCKNGFLRVKKG